MILFSVYTEVLHYMLYKTTAHSQYFLQTYAVHFLPILNIIIALPPED